MACLHAVQRWVLRVSLNLSHIVDSVLVTRCSAGATGVLFLRFMFVNKMRQYEQAIGCHENRVARAVSIPSKDGEHEKKTARDENDGMIRNKAAHRASRLSR